MVVNSYRIKYSIKQINNKNQLRACSSAVKIEDSATKQILYLTEKSLTL